MNRGKRRRTSDAGARALQRLGDEAGEAAVEALRERVAALDQTLRHAPDRARLARLRRGTLLSSETP